MKILGLTGSIASGKTTVAGWLRACGIPVHDADAAVHQLLASGGEAVGPIIDLFGPLVGSHAAGIDRKLLGDIVFGQPDRRKALEAVLHPMVRRHRDRFLADHRRAGNAIVVLDVPLLFETGGDSLCDHVIVVYARQETMRARALVRGGMTADKFDAVVAAQMPVADKLQRADLALDSDLLPAQTQQCLYDWLATLGHRCRPSPQQDNGSQAGI